MEIEFDRAKDEANRAKHGVSLAVAADFDLPNAFVTIDDREDYGEVRFNAYGLLNGRLYALTYTAVKWSG
jgi:uncharacterized protein